MAGLMNIANGQWTLILSPSFAAVAPPSAQVDPTDPGLWAILLMLLLITFLLGRRLGLSGRRTGSVGSHPSENSRVDPLVWRHEKLVLAERLEAEREIRVEEFATRVLAELKKTQNHGPLRAQVGLFLLTERFREERGRIGAELSRWQAVAAALASANNSPEEAFPRHRDLVAGLIHRLELNRDCLRDAQGVVGSFEETCVGSPETFTIGTLTDLLHRLGSPGSPLANLDTVNLADLIEPLRRLFADSQVADWEPIRKYLLLHGAEVSPATPSLRVWVRQLITDIGTTDGPAPPPSTPESVLRHGQVTQVNPPAELPAPTSADAPTSAGYLIVFCSNQVDLWGQDIYRGARHRARRIDTLPSWVRWISLSRLDTGERIFAAAASAAFGSNDSETSTGFNGSGESYYGARHLGMFAADCPNDIETRFTYGGWGFGHRSGDLALASENLQASGWAGREVADDIVFAIALHADLPKLGERDTVLGGGE